MVRHHHHFGAAASTAALAALVLAAGNTAARAQTTSTFGADAAANVRRVDSQFQVSESVPGEMIVGVRAGTDLVSARRHLEQAVGTTLRYDAALHLFKVRLRARAGVLDAVRALRGLGEVTYAEPNYVFHATGAAAVPNDTYYNVQWGPAKVQADAAWGAWKPAASTTIAIVDTGISISHEDLTNKILRDGGGNVVGYNFVANSANADDDNGHGTHCAGIAAAQVNNGRGIAGIAGWNGAAGSSDVNGTRLMPVKVLDSTGSGSLDSVASGITWAADHGARVISLSLGGSASTYTLQNAVNYAWNKGCVIVAAAGNNGTSAYSYPGACTNVISVAATDQNDTLASFSNWGSWVSVAAPGVSIASTYLNNGYVYMDGTSMATPFVAGEIALLASQNPSLTNADLKSVVVSNVDSVTSYTDPTAGSVHSVSAGRINVLRALNAVGVPAPAPTPAPAVPAAPSGLTASAVSRSQINLAWTNNATNATSLRIQYSANAGLSFADLGSGISPATNRVSVTGLASGTRYTFRVRAENAAGPSAWSNTASAITRLF